MATAAAGPSRPEKSTPRKGAVKVVSSGDEESGLYDHAHASLMVGVMFLTMMISLTLLVFVLGYWHTANENDRINGLLTKKYQGQLAEMGFVAADRSIFGGTDIEYELVREGRSSIGHVQDEGYWDFYGLYLDEAGIHFVINGAAFEGSRGFKEREAFNLASGLIEKIIKAAKNDQGE